MALLTQYEAYKRLRESLSGESEKISLESAQLELPEYGSSSSEPDPKGQAAVRESSLKESEAVGTSDAQKVYKHNKASNGLAIEGDEFPESVKTIQALGLDLGAINTTLNIVNKGGSLVSHVKDLYEGYKNMSPSDVARSIIQHMNSIMASTTGTTFNSLRQSLNPWFMWEWIGMVEGAEKPFPEAEVPGFFGDYNLKRDNILSLKDDYYWVATIKPPFMIDNLIYHGSPINDKYGLLLSLLVTEFKYNKAKLNTQSMKLAYGVDVQYPTLLAPEYSLDLTLYDTGENIIQRIMNEYYSAYKDPYGEGIPLPWEWYFEVQIIMFANIKGNLKFFHAFSLHCVPSEGSEFYSGESTHDSYGGTTLSMSVVGYGPGGNESPKVKLDEGDSGEEE